MWATLPWTVGRSSLSRTGRALSSTGGVGGAQVTDFITNKIVEQKSLDVHRNRSMFIFHWVKSTQCWYGILLPVQSVSVHVVIWVMIIVTVISMNCYRNFSYARPDS